MIFKMPHPNIIRVRDVFKSKGELGTTFEYLGKTTLLDLINQSDHAFSEKECLDLFAQVALAFKMVHENNIMHKNVNLDHLLVKETESKAKIVKLAGFSKLRIM